MTRYLLDTPILIDFCKAYEPTFSSVLRMIESDDDIALCAVVVAEFYFGLAPQERIRWSEFLDSLLFWQETLEVAKQAGIWRYEFARRGISLSTPDLLVAAVAHVNNAVLVTNNLRDFPMEEIRLLSPRG